MNLPHLVKNKFGFFFNFLFFTENLTQKKNWENFVIFFKFLNKKKKKKTQEILEKSPNF
jgi:hypothetical protein